MVVLGIDPGLANCGFGVVRAAQRAPGRARRRRARDARRRRARAPARRALHRRSTTCSLRHEPDAVALEALYFGAERPLGVRRRPGARRRPAAPPAAAASPCTDYTPQQVKGAVCGSGRADKDAGDADGPGAAGAARSRRRPTTPPTRSPSRSATPTTRRCAAPRRRRTWRACGDRARRRRGRGPPRRPRRRRDGRRRRLPARGLRRDAAPGAGRRASRVSLHAHLVVRDDAMPLYGFATEEERDLFLLLLGVQGVGPKVALAILSRRHAARARWRRSPPATRRASRPCPGIGKRTAERIIVELREKVAPRRRLRAGDRRHARRRPAARWPATACSSSASRRPRSTRCSPAPRARAPRSCSQSALKAARR